MIILVIGCIKHGDNYHQLTGITTNTCQKLKPLLVMRYSDEEIQPQDKEIGH